MDHRRKHAGQRSLADGDYEAGDSRHSASHPPGPRRSRLSTLGLLSLGLLVLFVGVITVVHFSHVSTLHTESVKGGAVASVVLRRQDTEVSAKAASTGGSGGGGGAVDDLAELGLGDEDDYGSDHDVDPGAVGENDHDGAGNDHPGDEGDDDDDGAGNDDPGDEGEKDDEGAANDDPVNTGSKDDDGSANDQPIDKGDNDDDGAANDEPVNTGSKDDDGGANDHPVDKGDKDDDGGANDHPIDKGDKDDDGGANDHPVDKGDKDDDGGANDHPIDKGDKDEEESEGDPLAAAGDSAAAVGENDDDGAQHDTPGNLDEDDDDTAAAASGGAATAAAAAVGSNGTKSGNSSSAATAAAATTKDGGGGKGIAGAVASDGKDAAAAASVADVEVADGSNPEEVDWVTDYDDDVGSIDVYVDVDPDVDGYDTNQDVDLRQENKQQKQQAEEQQQKQQQQAATQQKQQQQAATQQKQQKQPEAEEGHGTKDPEQDKQQQALKEQQQQAAEEHGRKQDKKKQAEEEAKPAVPTVAAAAVPSDGCGPLSRELLSQWAENHTVLLAFTNSVMFRTFGPTWLHHVRKAGIKYWVLAVADEETAKLVRSQGADHCFLVHENEIDDTVADFKWGSKSWQLHTWQKVLAVRHVHHLGFHVINSDMDVVWLRNPLEHFLIKYTDPDYWVSMDPITTQNPIGDDGPEVGVSTHHYMNTGVYFLRQTPGGRALIDKWYDIRNAMQKAGFHDQDGLYNYLKEGSQTVDYGRRVTMVVDGKTALAQLPATLFQNGYSHCINQIHKIHGLQPFEVHFVWVWGGNAGKISRMREAMYYIDPPSYHSDGFFLSYDIEKIDDPPGFNNWTDTEAMVQTHLKALDSQLTDTWHGLALAALLKRIFILPKMKCFCIQNWFENPQCRLPGEPHTRFPLAPACPADYVFNMDALTSFNLSGAAVHVREFSFLDNERTPNEVKERPLVVVARRGLSTARLDGDTLTIPAGLKSEPLLAALRPFLEPPPKRLHFRNPRLAFAGWSDPRVSSEFEAHVAGLAVRWCCRPDAIAKQLGTEVHHQLQVHAAPQSEAASRRLLQW